MRKTINDRRLFFQNKKKNNKEKSSQMRLFEILRKSLNKVRTFKKTMSPVKIGYILQKYKERNLLYFLPLQFLLCATSFDLQTLTMAFL